MELGILLLLLVFVTLVGHGIWVLLATFAAFFRALLGGDPTPPARPREPGPGRPEPCACCGQRVPAGLRRCDCCGLDRDSPLALTLKDLAATDRQLTTFLEAGGLDRAT